MSQNYVDISDDEDKLQQHHDLSNSNEGLIEDLKYKYSKLEKERDSLINDINEKNLIIENLESEVKRLKDHLIRSQQEYDNAIMDMNEMLQENDSKIKNIDDIIKQNEILTNMIHQKEEEINSYKVQIENLTVALNHYHMNHSTEIEIRSAHLKNRITELTKELEDKQKQIDLIESKEEDIETLKNQIKQISEDYENEKKKNDELHRQVSTLHNAFEDALTKISKRHEQNNETIDKSIVRKLIVTYMTRKGNQQLDVLKLMASMLDFDEEDQRAVGLIGGRKGWLRFLSFGSNEPNKKASLSDLWVDFLLKNLGENNNDIPSHEEQSQSLNENQETT